MDMTKIKVTIGQALWIGIYVVLLGGFSYTSYSKDQPSPSSAWKERLDRHFQSPGPGSEKSTKTSSKKSASSNPKKLSPLRRRDKRKVSRKSPAKKPVTVKPLSSSAPSIPELSQKLSSSSNNNYKGIGENPDELKYLESSKKALRCGCDDKGSMSQLVSSASSTVFNDFYRTFKNKDELCQKQALSSMMNNLQNMKSPDLFPKKCHDPKHQFSEFCKKMQSKVQAMKNRTGQLIELVYGKPSQQETESEFCFTCLLDKAFDFTKDDASQQEIGQVLKTMAKYSQCQDLSVGRTKTLTRKGHSYQITKTKNGEYSIPLNIRFQAGDGYDGPVARNQVSEFYQNKVQECLKKASSKMLGPDGQKLNIVLQKPNQGSRDICRQVASPRVVKIGSANTRSDISNYRSDIDCPTITHEILHLLGLCDEYKEKLLGLTVNSSTGRREYANVRGDGDSDQFPKAYNCRITKNNTIMKDQHERWYNTFNIQSNASLLDPEHFNAIMYGTCPSKNKIYNNCSALAYQTAPPDSCAARKRQCENEIQSQFKERLKKASVGGKQKKPLAQLLEQYNQLKKESKAEKKLLAQERAGYEKLHTKYKQQGAQYQSINNRLNKMGASIKADQNKRKKLSIPYEAARTAYYEAGIESRSAKDEKAKQLALQKRKTASPIIQKYFEQLDPLDEKIKEGLKSYNKLRKTVSQEHKKLESFRKGELESARQKLNKKTRAVNQKVKLINDLAEKINSIRNKTNTKTKKE